MSRVNTWFHRSDPDWFARTGDMSGLAGFLTDTNSETRGRAAYLLTTAAVGRTSVVDAAPALLAALGDQDTVVRFWAATALGATNVAGTVEPLAALLEDPNPGVGLAAAVALAGHRSTRGLDFLIGVLRDGTWSNDRIREASDTLVRLGKRAVRPLVRMLSDDSAASRSQAACVLRQIGWQPATASERILAGIAQRDWDAVAAEGDAATEPLRARLADSDDDVRQSAALALAAVGEPLGKGRLLAQYGGAAGVRKLLEETSSCVRARATNAREVLDLLGTEVPGP